jgi:hypothetical protein
MFIALPVLEAGMETAGGGGGGGGGGPPQLGTTLAATAETAPAAVIKPTVTAVTTLKRADNISEILR